MGAMSWKLVGGLSAVLAGVAARKIVEAGWERTTGKNPPSNPESPDTTWPEAIGWALLSGAAVGLARLVAARTAAAYYRKTTGALPPELEEITV